MTVQECSPNIEPLPLMTVPQELHVLEQSAGVSPEQFQVVWTTISFAVRASIFSDKRSLLAL